MENRPDGRKRNVTGTGGGLRKRGEGLGTGPVGKSDGYAGRNSSPQTPSSFSSQSSSSSSPRGVTRAGGGKLPIILIIVVAALVLFGGGGGLLGGLFGGGSQTGESGSSGGISDIVGNLIGGDSSGESGSSGGITNLLSGFIPSLSSLTNGSYSGSGSVSTGWDRSANTGVLNTSVASGSRAKRTAIKGNGNDTVTVMVYMCGTDLESGHGMATSDLQEMAAATLSSKVNLLVYTGGCKQWKNNVVSSSVNQIHKIESGGIKTLVSDDGRDPLTKSSVLTRFIRYCKDNYKADRYELILWDHGGGSVSGFGYDEKNPTSGSMTLKGINDALRNAGVTFDFIGFDACLMATLENALMLDEFADYLIASEETEPGVGWYHTGWLNALSSDTSIPTVELGKIIVDDFVSVCDQKCPGQKTTLSVIDLAELAHTVPSDFKSFATSTANMISGEGFKTVSDARASTREFSASNKIDQIDLVHLATNLGTAEAKELASSLLGAVKYNKTSSSVTNAYGLSIYFPYRKTSGVSSAVSTYEAIGMDDEYTKCIRNFASMEIGGQAASGGVSSPISSLLGSALPGQTTSSSGISSLFGSLLGGGSDLGGLSSLLSGAGGIFGKSIDMQAQAGYVADTLLPASKIVWTKDADGKNVLSLTEKEWGLVHNVLLNVFYDDGEGYLDLGLDNVVSFTARGDLLGEYDSAWVAIDGQNVAYYYEDSYYNGNDYIVRGRVPVLVNGERAELIVVFDSSREYGYVSGARTVYSSGETSTEAKAFELTEGDKIDYICDYYTYAGQYVDTYKIGDQVTYASGMKVSDVYLSDAQYAKATYIIEDVYAHEFYTPVIPG